MLKGIPIVLVLALTSCASLEEVRRQEPARVMTLSGDYRSIGVCIARENPGLTLLIDDPAQTAYLTFARHAETTLRQTGTDTVILEHRRAPQMLVGVSDEFEQRMRFCEAKATAAR